jgi:hypothetical protein
MINALSSRNPKGETGASLKRSSALMKNIGGQCGRGFATATLLAAWLSPIRAQEALSSDELVPIHGFLVQPIGNFSLDDGQIVLHPKALTGIGYDSNVYATRSDPSADYYWHGMIGIFSRYSANRELSMSFDGEYERQLFRTDTDRDATIGHAVFTLTGSGPGYGWGAEIGIIRLDDPLFDSGDRALHEVATIHLGLNQDDVIRHQDFSIEYQRQEYLQDTPFFNRHDIDSNSATAVIHEGILPLPDNEWYFGAFTGFNRYDDRHYNSSLRATSFIGWEQEIGGRSRADISIGASWWKFEDNFSHDPSFDDREVYSPYVDASVHWSWAERVDMHASVYSHLLESLTSNAYRAVGGEIGGQLGLLDGSMAFIAVRVFEARGSGAAAGQEIEVRRNEEGTIGFDYVLHDGVVVRVEGDYIDSLSRTSNSYDRLSATIDMAVVY